MAFSINLGRLTRSSQTAKKFIYPVSIKFASTSSNYFVYEKDPSRYFFNPEIQKLLKSITRIEIEKIFHKRATPNNNVEYKFLTDNQIDSEVRRKFKDAQRLLQMPPVVEVLKENLKVLSDDPAIAGYAKSPLVFTDVTFALNNLERTVVIRHLDGKLVEAPFEVRKRVSQIYNPMPGRKLSEPRMFEPDNLNRILEEGEYTFILDNLCLHFEPFEAKFHEISSKVYQHVNENLKFDSLRSTRHFGPMAFFLAWHKIIDDLLIDMIRNDFLKNGVELICLLFKIKGIEADTSILEKLQEIDEIELLINRTVDAMLSKLDENKIQKTNEDLQIDELCFAFIQNSYVNVHSPKKPQLELVLQSYKERHNELKNIAQEIN